MNVMSFSSNDARTVEAEAERAEWAAVDDHWRHDHRANVHALQHRRQLGVATRDLVRRCEQHRLGRAHRVRQRHATRHREAPPRVGDVGRQATHRHELEHDAVGREHRDLARRRTEGWQTFRNDDTRHRDRRQRAGERFRRAPKPTRPVRRSLRRVPRRLGPQQQLVALGIGFPHDGRRTHDQQQERDHDHADERAHPAFSRDPVRVAREEPQRAKTDRDDERRRNELPHHRTANRPMRRRASRPLVRSREQNAECS